MEEPMSCLTEIGLSQQDSEMRPIIQMEKQIERSHNQIVDIIEKSKISQLHTQETASKFESDSEESTVLIITEPSRMVHHVKEKKCQNSKSESESESESESDSDSESDSEDSIILDNIRKIANPQKETNVKIAPYIQKIQQRNNEHSPITPLSARVLPRSSFMKTLNGGSIYIKQEFPQEILPKILRGNTIYEVDDKSVERSTDILENSYIVKRFVDFALDINVKTIDNYFRKNPPENDHIGYVIHSKCFPKEGQKELSSCHKYLVIKLSYLQIWWATSTTMQRKMKSSKVYTWPSMDKDKY
mgnify:FL=1|jgi:hypothetical protein